MPKFSIPVIITTAGQIIFEAADLKAAKEIVKTHWAAFEEHKQSSKTFFDQSLLSNVVEEVRSGLKEIQEIKDDNIE